MAGIRVSDAKAFFSYLARADGRVPNARNFSRNAPHRDAQGIRRFNATEKCELLADHFEEKLNPPGYRGATRISEKELPNKKDRKVKGNIDRLGGSVRKSSKSGKAVPEGYRGLVQGTFEEIRAVEVTKAISILSVGKAAGPDGVPAEIYKEMPTLWEHIKVFINCVLSKGRVPAPLLMVHPVPLDKPQKDPEECKSKRPISLINTMAKVIEAIAHHRLLTLFEAYLEPRQYAYRRSCSTEMHLQELMSFLISAKNREWPVYVASIDVKGAFDTVPHALLVKTPEVAGVGGHYCRFIHTWLTQRKFQVRLTTPKGASYSGARTSGRGLPQGGVISPFLWLIHFNGILRTMAERREATGLTEEEMKAKFRELAFADDLIIAIAHPQREVVESLA